MGAECDKGCAKCALLRISAKALGQPFHECDRRPQALAAVLESINEERLNA